MPDASLIFPDGRELRLERDLSIGRGDDNDISLSTKAVSRRHARITTREGRWFLEDLGSRNGTFLNGARLRPGLPLPLRHADRINVDGEPFTFAVLLTPQEQEDETISQELAPDAWRPLSPFQSQVVRCLCAEWLAGGSLDRLPTNEEVALTLGTPEAAGAVKAALRRAYAKAGLRDEPSHAKRRALCRIARERGWI